MPSLYPDAFSLPFSFHSGPIQQFFFGIPAVKNLVTWFNFPIRSQVFRVVLTVKIKQFSISIVIIQQQQLSIIYQYLSSSQLLNNQQCADSALRRRFSLGT